MLIEVYRSSVHVVYHNTENGDHYAAKWAHEEPRYYEPCWHSPDTPCPAVEKEKGEQP